MSLLDELAGQEIKPGEQLILPDEKITSAHLMGRILLSSEKRIELSELAGNNILLNMSASYLISNVDANTVNSYLDKENPIEKLVIADISAGLGTETTVDPSDSLSKIYLAAAGDIYRDVFNVLSLPLYAKKLHKLKGNQAQNKIEAFADPFFAVRGAHIEPFMAASYLVKFCDGERINYIRNRDELKAMIAVGVYKRLIRDKEIVTEIDSHLNSPEHSMDDVLVYSILQLHRDFFKTMEGMKNDK